jgi:hypothetical protein
MIKYLVKIEKFDENGEKDISWKIFSKKISFYIWKKRMGMEKNVNFITYNKTDMKNLTLEDLENFSLYLFKRILLEI